YNVWPLTTQETVTDDLWALTNRHWTPEDPAEMNVKDYDALRITFGDKSRFIMPKLLYVLEDPNASIELKRMASRFFSRGGTRMAYLGPNLTEEQKQFNQKTAKDNQLLRTLVIDPADDAAAIQRKIAEMKHWYTQNADLYHFEPTQWEKVKIFF